MIKCFLLNYISFFYFGKSIHYSPFKIIVFRISKNNEKYFLEFQVQKISGNSIHMNIKLQANGNGQ